MKVYLDEHIHLTMASLLHARGIDCVTTRDAGNLGCSDEAQLAFATSHGRAILTLNHKDFLQLAKQWHETGRSHAGIILSKELAIPDLIRRLHDSLPTMQRRISQTASSGSPASRITPDTENYPHAVEPTVITRHSGNRTSPCLLRSVPTADGLLENSLSPALP